MQSHKSRHRECRSYLQDGTLKKAILKLQVDKKLFVNCQCKAVAKLGNLILGKIKEH